MPAESLVDLGSTSRGAEGLCYLRERLLCCEKARRGGALGTQRGWTSTEPGEGVRGWACSQWSGLPVVRAKEGIDWQGLIRERTYGKQRRLAQRKVLAANTQITKE